jgi:hypothetical protein
MKRSSQIRLLTQADYANSLDRFYNRKKKKAAHRAAFFHGIAQVVSLRQQAYLRTPFHPLHLRSVMESDLWR